MKSNTYSVRMWINKRLVDGWDEYWELIISEFFDSQKKNQISDTTQRSEEREYKQINNSLFVVKTQFPKRFRQTELYPVWNLQKNFGWLGANQSGIKNSKNGTDATWYSFWEFTWASRKQPCLLWQFDTSLPSFYIEIQFAATKGIKKLKMLRYLHRNRLLCLRRGKWRWRTHGTFCVQRSCRLKKKKNVARRKHFAEEENKLVIIMLLAFFGWVSPLWMEKYFWRYMAAVNLFYESANDGEY